MIKKLTISIISIISFAIMILLIIDTDKGASSLDRYNVAPKKASTLEEDYVNIFTPTYKSNNVEPELESLQCPIPPEDRVRNYTGIQCVYSSIEALGRWAEEPKLMDPPLTSRPDCKSYSGPKQAGAILEKLKVKFEQTYGDKEKGIKLIKKAMQEGRGCLWDVPGHAMILVHYDEKNNRVCWVDNSDRSLKVQETTIEKFNKRWGSWVLVVYADIDVIPHKINKINIPIIENGITKEFSIDFIPFPIN